MHCRQTQNRAANKGHRPKNHHFPTAGITSQLLREGCRAGTDWSASHCCACWSLWLAGPGSLSLLAVVPDFSVCFPVTSVAVLRYKGTDPRTGKFWSGTPTILVLLYSLIADYYPTAPCRRPWEAPGRTETVVLEFDSLFSSTSDIYVITLVHMKRLNDGRLVDLGCLMMLCSFKNQVQVQL